MSDDEYTAQDQVIRAICGIPPDCFEFADEDDSGYGDYDHPDDFDYWLDECGRQPDDTCLMAGTEECDWDCPFSRSEAATV